MALHTLCHVEWEVSDLKKAQEFYAGLFPSWKFEPWGDDYLMFTPEVMPGGGLAKVDKVTPVVNPILYFYVNEIEPYLDKVIKLGGKVEQGVSEIPKIGWYALVLDPDGNRIGLFKNLPEA